MMKLSILRLSLLFLWASVFSMPCLGSNIQAAMVNDTPVFTQVKKLTASDGAAYDFFGSRLAISGDTAIVGASQNDAQGSNSGAAYIFERDRGGTNNWGLVKKVTALDGDSDDSFGTDVAISGDTVVIGAKLDEDLGLGAGAAYIFARNQGGADNWGQVKKIFASDGVASDNFGYAVAISGDTVVVATPWDENEYGQAGAAYVFYRNQGGADNWGQVKKITASDGSLEDFFGTSVSIGGDTVVVGAKSDDDKGHSSGSVYVFGRNQGGADNWGQVAKITASDGSADDFFGSAVSISASTILVGANYDDDQGTSSGSAYIFQSMLTGAKASPGILLLLLGE